MSRKHFSATNLAIYGGAVLGVLGGLHYLIHKNVKIPVTPNEAAKLKRMNVPHENIIDIQNFNENDKTRASRYDSAIDHNDILTYVDPSEYKEFTAKVKNPNISKITRKKNKTGATKKKKK